MQPASLVTSTIIHTRHQPVAHKLERQGLSLLIDLDRLEEAGKISGLFSVGGFNLLSFDERDHGPNHGVGRKVEPLATYIRRLAYQLRPKSIVARIELLTFPRILGQVFNPISVYQCYDSSGAVIMTVYEVRNTFGDMHTYVGLDDELHEVSKVFHVSPFFPVEGRYRLLIRQQDNRIRLIIRYLMAKDVALTATLRGDIHPLTTANILQVMVKLRLWPMRPLLSIHWEALKLWRKKIPFFSRPQPPGVRWTLARQKGNTR